MDLAVAAGALRGLLGALQGLADRAECVRQQRHPLVLVTHLEELLLGLWRQLDACCDRVGAGAVELLGLGSLAGGPLSELREVFPRARRPLPAPRRLDLMHG